MVTPAERHAGNGDLINRQRQEVLDVAYNTHPIRFPKGRPTPPKQPSLVELLYQYTVQFTVDEQTFSAGEIGPTNRYDLEDEVPLLVDLQTGAVGFDTVASPTTLILGGGILMLLGLGVLTFHFTKKSRVNNNLFQPGTNSQNGTAVPPALSGKATSSRFSLSQFAPHPG